MPPSWITDIKLLSRVSGLSSDSRFLSPILFFCLVILLFLSCHFSANGPFSFFSPKTLKYFSLRVRLFCMALVEQLGDDGRWYVQLAAIYMALVFAIMHIYTNLFLFFIVSVHSFFFFLFLFL